MKVNLENKGLTVTHEHTLPPDCVQQDKRLPELLRETWPETFKTGSSAKNACRRHQVLVDGCVGHTWTVVNAGQTLQLVTRAQGGPPVEDAHLLPQLEVVYEDHHMACVRKPTGIPTQGSGVNTMQGRLKYGLQRCNVLGALYRPIHVHRLDQDTGGLLVAAKTRAALQHLSAQFQSHAVRKTYVALVVGLLEGSGTIDLPLSGQHAVTDYCVLQHTPSALYGTITTVQLQPRTGRTHQLRRHLASLGHPILGDPRYMPLPPSPLQNPIPLPTSAAFPNPLPAPASGSPSSASTSLQSQKTGICPVSEAATTTTSPVLNSTETTWAGKEIPPDESAACTPSTSSCVPVRQSQANAENSTCTPGDGVSSSNASQLAHDVTRGGVTASSSTAPRPTPDLRGAVSEAVGGVACSEAAEQGCPSSLQSTGVSSGGLGNPGDSSRAGLSPSGHGGALGAGRVSPLGHEEGGANGDGDGDGDDDGVQPGQANGAVSSSGEGQRLVHALSNGKAVGLCLYAVGVRLQHPASGEELVLSTPQPPVFDTVRDAELACAGVAGAQAAE